ncbi:hypothetical protein ABPG75_001492 [Micractinium tetrahymenae]
MTSRACLCSPPAARAPSRAAPATTRPLPSFADQRHTLFYGGGSGTLAPAPAARGHRQLRPSAFASSAASSSPSVSPRRARLAQQLASVEETLRRLEERAGQPLPAAEAALPTLPAAQPRRRPARASMQRASSSSDSSSSSESEAEQPSVSRLARRLQAELTARRDAAAAAAAAGNIVPSPGAYAGLAAAAPPQHPAAAAAAAPATSVRVCTGKKCSAGGAGAVLATLGSLPGVHAAAAPKCMGQCKRCVAVKMASGPGPEVLYTGVNASNAAGVLAMHQQQHGQQAHARALGHSCALPSA